ncbi:phage tail protein, P2 protein I family [Actinokineospora alba]|uniref:Phage tail protein, P2 protein I family n=1 Tax=Actinokineospora alba TaxID=504798 RepID=A0A1H0F5A2_9PSEU|nr:phage tail protein [Actinokineospora alba]TDP69346.1 phage tail P2-like protein [Actinokineospora alba]SDI18765.1 phage tail protein, P2 protein I family [Actinokineospora alba]SDN89834.1 phage tail protein, P2 protein I family [Actinokineospora alba]
MRAAAPGLGTPYPLGTLLPPVLQEDAVAMRITAALDEVLTPVIATLDCLWCYVDPALAPPDFLDWLAGWVGVTLDENWLMEHRRATVAHAVDLHRARGTARGLRAYLEAATGGRIDVVDSGGVAVSTTPGGALPGSDQQRLTVRVCPPRSGSVDVSTVEKLVAEAKPAHVLHQVELVAQLHDKATVQPIGA